MAKSVEDTAVKSASDTGGCGGARPKTAPRSTVPDMETPPLPPPRNL